MALARHLGAGAEMLERLLLLAPAQLAVEYRRLESELGLPFTRYLPKLRGMNRFTSRELIIRPSNIST